MDTPDTDREVSELAELAIDPVAAEEVDDGDCQYDGCDETADLLVEFKHEFAGNVATATARLCDGCDRQNAIHARANGLLEYKVTA